MVSEGQKRNKIKRKKAFFSIFLELAVRGGGRENQILERESPTSLSRLSDRRFASGQEAKLLYSARATCGHQFCRVSTTSGGRGFLLLDLIPF